MYVTMHGVILAMLVLAATALAQDFPAIDFEGLGAVSVAGSFGGVSIWSPATSSLNESNVYDGNAGSLVHRDGNGQMAKINSTNAGGRINVVCQRTTPPNTVYVGGLFSQIAGLNTSNVASYDPASKSWDLMNGGVDGEVLALYCDEPHALLFAGGSFRRPANVSRVTDTSRYLGNLAMWNMTNREWLPVPFGGLNGTVTQISTGLNASTLRFAGAFDTEFSSGEGGQSISGTNTSASPYSIAYTPLPLAQSEFQGGPSSSNGAFSNPAQILCPQGGDGQYNTYLFADNTVGRLTMRAFRNLPVSGIRLANTFVDGRGTREFNIISLPDNTQLELLYLDPVTQRNVTCTTCPLFHDPAVPFQDFLITDNPANGLQNGVKELTGIQFTATSWYGAGAGLHLLELLSNGAWAYAYQGYNGASCTSGVEGARGSQSYATNEGEWYRTTVTTSTPATLQPVLALSDDYSRIASHANDIVTWHPTVHYAGNYTVNLFVPGCAQGFQCNVRTDVQARVIGNGSVDPNSVPWTRVSQTNEQDAVVPIYSGEVSRSTDGFQPYVQLTIPTDAPRPSGSDRFSVYADRISLTLLNSNETNPYYHGEGFGVLEYNVFDVNANNNSLAYGANPFLYNTTLIEQLLESSAPSTLPNGQRVETESVQQYIRTLSSNLYSATGPLPNSTMTPVDFFSVSLERAGVLRNQSSIVFDIQSVVNRTYIGGSFMSRNATNGTDQANPAPGFANFVAYDEASEGKEIVRLNGGGTNGAVRTLASVESYIYLGGDFTATLDNRTALPHIARYDSRTDSWASLGSGLNGPVTSIRVQGTRLLVSGAFTAVNGSDINTGALAVYDMASRLWITDTTPIVGTISNVFPIGSSDQAWLVGQVASVGEVTAVAAIGLSAPAQPGQYPNITTLNLGFPGGSQPSEPAVPSGAVPPPNARRSLSGLTASAAVVPRHTASAPIFEARRARSSGFFRRLLARALASGTNRNDFTPPIALSKRADAMDPVSLASDGGNEVLASAFWQPSANTYWTVLGGNFTTPTGVRNLGVYNPSRNDFEQFPPFPAGSNLSVVRALYVDKDTMYVGGDGGILSFDMRNGRWNSIPPLTAAPGTVLSVQTITHRPGSNTMIMAGTFSSAGSAASLPCLNICQWDTSQRRWTGLGNGVDGQIAAVDFAGGKASTLVAAGSMTLMGREVALAEYSFDSNTWSAIGSVGSGEGAAPGPATAVSVDSLNLNAIYVAGRSMEGTYPYFLKWDGQTFTDLNRGQLLDSTGVAQLTFVGLLRRHADNPVMESNRMVVLSGALNTRDFGNVSSALFDGAQYTPFVKTSRQDGTPGIVRAFTRSVETLTFSNMHHLAVGLVILISIALGLAVVFLLVLIGLIWALLFRRKNKNGVAVAHSDSDESLVDSNAAGTNGSGKQRPSSLLATLNKATENVINEHKDVYSDDGHDYSRGAMAAGIGGMAAYNGRRGYDETTYGHGTLENSDETTGHGGYSSQGHSGVSRYYSGEEDVGAGAGAAAAAAAASRGPSGGETEGIEAHARYAFEATHSSELGVEAGERIWILDDQDEHWWLARNAYGKTGVLPASYVL